MLNNPMQLIQTLNQFLGMNPDLNTSNAQEIGEKLIQQANLSQTELNKIQNGANMIFKMAQRFGLIN